MLADSCGPTVTPCQSLGGDSWQQVTSLNANLGQDGKQPNIELVGLMYHGQSGLLRWTLNLVPKRPPQNARSGLLRMSATGETGWDFQFHGYSGEREGGTFCSMDIVLRERAGLPVPWI